MSYTDAMYDHDEHLDTRSRHVKDIALQRGAKVCSERYAQTKRPVKDFQLVQLQGYLFAEEELRVHLEYQDRAGRFREWYAYWYCVGYVGQEERLVQEMYAYQRTDHPEYN